MVLRAKSDSSVALNSLCSTYRSPLLVWLRCRGQNASDAEDLVQGFFEHMLQSDFLGNVAREKGRFRTFLLTSFQNHLRDQHKRAAAQKRGGGLQPLSLEETNEEGDLLREPAARQSGPDEAYDREWAKTLLSGSLRRLKQECARTGHEALYAALEPVLFADPDAPAYTTIAGELGMSEAAVKMAAMRTRKRLATIIREEVMQTVTNEEELRVELAHLAGLFGKS
jgi:RNA polymerase sigma-70 factor (ECF subfamily)